MELRHKYDVYIYIHVYMYIHVVIYIYIYLSTYVLQLRMGHLRVSLGHAVGACSSASPPGGSVDRRCNSGNTDRAVYIQRCWAMADAEGRSTLSTYGDVDQTVD